MNNLARTQTGNQGRRVDMERLARARAAARMFLALGSYAPLAEAIRNDPVAAQAWFGDPSFGASLERMFGQLRATQDMAEAALEAGDNARALELYEAMGRAAWEVMRAIERQSSRVGRIVRDVYGEAAYQTLRALGRAAGDAAKGFWTVGKSILAGAFGLGLLWYLGRRNED